MLNQGSMNNLHDLFSYSSYLVGICGFYRIQLSNSFAIIYHKCQVKNVFTLFQGNMMLSDACFKSIKFRAQCKEMWRLSKRK